MYGYRRPGILNMVTALTAAMSDRTPVVAISGEVPTSWEGMGASGCLRRGDRRHLRAAQGVTGLSVSMSAPAVVPHHLRHAVTIALTERMPTHISVPIDVQHAEIDASWQPIEADLISPEIVDERSLAELAATLAKPDHQRIVILAGPGWLTPTAPIDCAHLPSGSTSRWPRRCPEGLIAETHPLALGVFGYGGSRWATDAILSPISTS